MHRAASPGSRTPTQGWLLPELGPPAGLPLTTPPRADPHRVHAYTHTHTHTPPPPWEAPGQLRTRLLYLRRPTPNPPAVSATADPQPLAARPGGAGQGRAGYGGGGGGARPGPSSRRRRCGAVALSTVHRARGRYPQPPALRPSIPQCSAPRGDGGRYPQRPAPAVTEQRRAEPRQGRSPGLVLLRRHGRAGAAAAPPAVAIATAPPALPPGKQARPRRRRTNSSAELRTPPNQHLGEAGLSGAADRVQDGAAKRTKRLKLAVSGRGPRGEAAAGRPRDGDGRAAPRDPLRFPPSPPNTARTPGRCLPPAASRRPPVSRGVPPSPRASRSLPWLRAGSQRVPRASTGI